MYALHAPPPRPPPPPLLLATAMRAPQLQRAYASALGLTHKACTCLKASLVAMRMRASASLVAMRMRACEWSQARPPQVLVAR